MVLGKLFGLEGDYYIVLGINYKNYYEFPQKIFYYATNQNFVFSRLPETFEYHDQDNRNNYSNPIVGNPTIVLKKYQEEEDPNNPVDPQAQDDVKPQDDPQQMDINLMNPDESKDDIKKVEEKKENFTELLKISYLVRNIDWDTNIFPQGAFRLIPEHELRRNESFKGLKPEELKDLSKFHHFRPITEEKNKELIELDEAIFRYDLLDCLRNDTVKGSWSIQLDSTKTIVIYY